ncbi:MAG: 2-C-methyl-D-erythritol 2,4-cyclodiphosphate synthase [Acidobacteria bacterium]|nr:MAG: 2-C-methyl-D-erythritol 2,4-cyclodiphosphate synthase [Acidobacteriota bacterium]RLE23286.1 MAG: 2-C-methyl-D-erythritol 2,4-cyclodiphosphate synthase [Acidobacteriota bacterium]
MNDFRIGQGIDFHRFEPGRRLVLGGVEFNEPYGLTGHSDADVVLHAVADAVLGAVGLGDIGMHFPDTDSRWKNADSRELLREVVALASEEGWKVGNADVTVIGQQPKIAVHRGEMEHSIADILGVSPGNVNVKATTTEAMGFLGREEGLATLAIVMMVRNRQANR